MTRLTRAVRGGTRQVCAAALVVVLGGCPAGGPVAGGSSTPGASPAPTAMTDQQLLAIGREYAQCLRDHGIPAFPDMDLVGGQLALPNSPAGEAAGQALRENPAAAEACRSILAKLPPSARKNGGVSPDDLRALLQFARCIREHGIPDWPDPQGDGSFPLTGTALENETKSARWQTALQACRQYWDGRISVK